MYHEVLCNTRLVIRVDEDVERVRRDMSTSVMKVV